MGSTAPSTACERRWETKRTTDRFIETLERRGYRFIAPVGAPEAKPPEKPPAAPDTGARAPRGRRRARWLGGAVAVAVAALLIALGPALRRTANSADHAPIRSLAVLPLANLSGDPAQDYFSDGMTDALITNLASLPALRVISRQSVMRYKGSAKPLPNRARSWAWKVSWKARWCDRPGACASRRASSTLRPIATYGGKATSAVWRTCSRSRTRCRARSPRRSASLSPATAARGRRARGR